MRWVTGGKRDRCSRWCVLWFGVSAKSSFDYLRTGSLGAADHALLAPVMCPTIRSMEEHTAAFERFWKSTSLTYDQWHDGVGYDVAALSEMTAAERDEVVRTLPVRVWQDVEALTAVATPEARGALRSALRSSSAEMRLRAAEALRSLGEAVDLESMVATELSNATIVDGMVFALRLATIYPTAEVRHALLVEAGRRPEVGPHYGALLCYLTGVAKTHFDFAMRPFFLRLGEHASRSDRRAAFEQLCRMTGMSAA